MYEPEEDSIMLKERILFYLEKKHKKKKAELGIDLGTGSGIQGLTMEPYCEKIICSDINPESIKVVKEIVKNNSKYKLIESDLYEKYEKKYQGKADIIVFNPPYLPREKEEKDDVELTSGEEGIDITTKFIKESKKYLKKTGKLFFVVSSLANTNSINNVLKSEGYKHKIVKKKHFFFEDIMIYEAGLE